MKTQRFDVAEYLDSEAMIAAYLSSVLEDRDTDEFIAALGDVACAKGYENGGGCGSRFF